MTDKGTMLLINTIGILHIKIVCSSKINKNIFVYSIINITFVTSNYKTMAKDKRINLLIPAKLNSELNHYLLKLRDLNIDITKAELIIRLADLGLKVEKKEIEISKE